MVFGTLSVSLNPKKSDVKFLIGSIGMENLYKVGGSLKRINKAKTLLWQGKVNETIATFAAL